MADIGDLRSWAPRHRPCCRTYPGYSCARVMAMSSGRPASASGWPEGLRTRYRGSRELEESFAPSHSVPLGAVRTFLVGSIRQRRRCPACTGAARRTIAEQPPGKLAHLPGRRTEAGHEPGRLPAHVARYRIVAVQGGAGDVLRAIEETPPSPSPAGQVTGLLAWLRAGRATTTAVARSPSPVAAHRSCQAIPARRLSR